MALVTALVIVSLLVSFGIPGVVKPRKTELGLDLQRRRRADLQGRATARLEGDAGDDQPGDQHHAVARQPARRQRRLGDERTATTRSTSASPDVKSVQQAENEVGTTAQLYFYDWEASVIGPNGKVAGPNCVRGHAATVTRRVPTAGIRAPRPPRSASTTPCSAPPSSRARSPSRRSAPYYLGRRPGTNYIVDPAKKKVLTPKGETAPTRQEAVGYLNADLAQSNIRKPADAQVIYVKPGTVVRQALTTPTTRPTRAHDFYYVLRDDPAISGKDITNPLESTDPTGEPDVSFGFTQGAATQTFQQVTAVLAQPRLEQLDRRRLQLPALRGHARPAPDHGPLHRLQPVLGRHRCQPGQPDLGRLHDRHGAAAREPALEWRAPDQPRRDLEPAGRRDARPPGAQPGARRGRRGPPDRRALPAALLPRTRR